MLKEKGGAEGGGGGKEWGSYGRKKTDHANEILLQSCIFKVKKKRVNW
jgi:hypothetical protein